MSRLPRRALDRAHDALIGAAATDIRAHVLDDLVARGLGVLLQEIGRTHDLAGLAVAALRHSLGEPGFLHRMTAAGRQAFDGGDRFVREFGELRLAGIGALAVDMYHAGAAQAGAAAELGTGKLQAFTHNPEQRSLWRCLDRHRFAVDGKVYRHCFPSWLSARSASDAVGLSFPTSARPSPPDDARIGARIGVWHACWASALGTIRHRPPGLGHHRGAAVFTVTPRSLGNIWSDQPTAASSSNTSRPGMGGWPGRLLQE